MHARVLSPVHHPLAGAVQKVPVVPGGPAARLPALQRRSQWTLVLFISCCLLASTAPWPRAPGESSQQVVCHHACPGPPTQVVCHHACPGPPTQGHTLLPPASALPSTRTAPSISLSAALHLHNLDQPLNQPHTFTAPPPPHPPSLHLTHHPWLPPTRRDTASS